MSKRNGLSIGPYGTPAIISSHELKLLFTPVFSKCCTKQLRIYAKEIMEEPFVSSFTVNRPWFRRFWEVHENSINKITPS